MAPVSHTVMRWLLLPPVSGRNASSAQRYGFGLSRDVIKPNCWRQHDCGSD